MNSEETKRRKAIQLRYKKPIARYLNLDFILENLSDMQEACEDVRWFTESEDESLLEELLDSEEEAYEFKMAFADLCGECERMWEDLHEEWIPECFDIFFVATGAGDMYGGLYGWDPYEGDYLGINCLDSFAEDEAKKKLMRLTKKELIVAARQCFKVYSAYIGLQTRYDSLKAAIDILRDQNKGYLQVVKEIENLYNKVSADEWTRHEWSKESKEWERYTDALPQEVWII